jgi:hypothetical protein
MFWKLNLSPSSGKNEKDRKPLLPHALAEIVSDPDRFSIEVPRARYEDGGRSSF